MIGNACSINYRISDSDSSVRFKIIEKINGVKIAEKIMLLMETMN